MKNQMNEKLVQEIISAAEVETNYYSFKDVEHIRCYDLEIKLKKIGKNVHFYFYSEKRILREGVNLVDLTACGNWCEFIIVPIF